MEPAKKACNIVDNNNKNDDNNKPDNNNNKPDNKNVKGQTSSKKGQTKTVPAIIATEILRANNAVEDSIASRTRQQLNSAPRVQTGKPKLALKIMENYSA